MGGLETQAAILVKEYVERKTLRKLGYSTPLDELSVLDAEIYLYLTHVFADLEEKDIKKSGK